MTREKAIAVIWNRCQHCKETEEAIKALKEQMICPIFSDDEVKQPCVKSPCGFDRPHGEWEHWGSPFTDDSIANSIVCSLCKARYVEIEGEVFNYCPNCGADMRRKESEAE